MKEKNDKPIEGYDFSLKKEEIKKIFNTTDYDDYKTQKKKTQKRKETVYKFSSLGNSTNSVKNLIILNVVVFIVTFYIFPSLLSIFAVFNIVDPNFAIWQPITYMFLHSGWIHLAINMFVFWSFANPLEQTLNTNKMLKIYFLGGLIGGILAMLTAPLGAHTVGASGAICGLMAAFVLIAPDSKVLLFFLIPMKMKYGVYGFAAFSLIFGLLSLINPSYGFGVSHFGHLGGLIGGWALTYYWKTKKLIPTF